MMNTKRESEKQQEKSSYLSGGSHKTISSFLNENFAGKKRMAQNIESD